MGQTNTTSEDNPIHGLAEVLRRSKRTSNADVATLFHQLAALNDAKDPGALADRVLQALEARAGAPDPSPKAPQWLAFAAIVAVIAVVGGGGAGAVVAGFLREPQPGATPTVQPSATAAAPSAATAIPAPPTATAPADSGPLQIIIRNDMGPKWEKGYPIHVPGAELPELSGKHWVVKRTNGSGSAQDVPVYRAWDGSLIFSIQDEIDVAAENKEYMVESRNGPAPSSGQPAESPNELQKWANYFAPPGPDGSVLGLWPLRREKRGLDVRPDAPMLNSIELLDSTLEKARHLMPTQDGRLAWSVGLSADAISFVGTAGLKPTDAGAKISTGTQIKSLTLETWVWSDPPSEDAFYPLFYFKTKATGGTPAATALADGDEAEVLVSLAGGSKLELKIAPAKTGTALITCQADKPVVPKRWQHVAVSWTSTFKSGAFYVNGKRTGMCPAAAPAITHLTPDWTTFRIGYLEKDRIGQAKDLGFHGQLQHVRLMMDSPEANTATPFFTHVRVPPEVKVAVPAKQDAR